MFVGLWKSLLLLSNCHNCHNCRLFFYMVVCRSVEENNPDQKPTSLNQHLTLIKMSHYLLVIALRTLDLVSHTAIPDANGFLYIIRRIILTHDDDKHLSTLLHIEAILQRKAFLLATRLQYQVAVLHANGLYLHRSATVATAGIGVAPTLYFSYCIHYRIPVERLLSLSIAIGGNTHENYY